MSTTIMAACWPIQTSPTAKAVLMSLADNANDDGYCWPSLATIAERTCLSRTAVIHAIRRLEEQGHVTADRSNGRHTTYQITIQPVRQAHRSTRNADARVGPEPVHEEHRYTSHTGPPDVPDQCASRTGPVREAHSNRHEPSRTVICSSVSNETDEKLSGAEDDDADDTETGSRLPPAPVKRIIALYHHLLPELSRMEIVNRQREQFIRSRWREQLVMHNIATQREGLEHFAKLFRYVRLSAFLMGRSVPTGGRPPFAADLEWLMRPANFAKVFEGKYHHGR